MLKFPSIDSFRHAVATVKRACDYKQIPYPKIAYEGSVKLHGTNAGIHVNGSFTQLTPQSRERVLTLEADNAGFARWVHENEDALLTYFRINFLAYTDPDKGLTVFGEWIGPGVQKNVAINQLDTRKFVAMNIVFHDTIDTTDDGQTLAEFHHGMIYSHGAAEPPPNYHLITEVCPQVIEIDFAQPDLAVAELEKLTSEYEEKCPFAAKFGIEGIGEGLVWIPASPADGVLPINMQHRLWFKTKGEKHGNKGTNNTVKVAVTAEKVEDFNALLAQIMPEWRLEQGLSKLKETGEPTKAQTGDFIKWVVGDVHKEEIDTVEASEFEWKIVAGELSKRARQWFFTKV